MLIICIKQKDVLQKILNIKIFILIKTIYFDVLRDTKEYINEKYEYRFLKYCMN